VNTVSPLRYGSSIHDCIRDVYTPFMPSVFPHWVKGEEEKSKERRAENQ
jgi:hypothetical protein